MDRAFTTLFGIVLLLAGHTAGADEFPGITRLMTGAEFEAAGLDKLSPDEVAALNAWLVRYTADEAEVLSQRVEEIKEARTTTILARIVGEFNGWSGSTRFVLDNGQVWQQRNDGQYRVRLQNPEVEIKRNIMGFYVLRLAGKNRRVGVKRIQ